MQIARVPHVAPDAWLHDIYAPITDVEQNVLCDNCKGYVASQLFEMHKEFNGLNLFSSNLYLYGSRINYVRSKDNVLPWDLRIPNDETRSRLPNGGLLIGGSNALPQGIWFIEMNGRTVAAVDRKRIDHALYEWRDLRDCLFSEVSRLDLLFDERGCPIDGDLLSKVGQNRS